MGKLQAPVGDEHLRSIGQITVNFSLLELSLCMFIWFLNPVGDVWSFEQQRVGQIITARLGFQTLLDLLSSLFRHRIGNPEAIEQLDSLLARASGAYQKRNEVTHSFWAAGATDETITRFKMTTKRRKGFKPTSEQMSLKALNSIADDIAIVAGDIQEFMFRVLEGDSEVTSSAAG